MGRQRSSHKFCIYLQNEEEGLQPQDARAHKRQRAVSTHGNNLMPVLGLLLVSTQNLYKAFKNKQQSTLLLLILVLENMNRDFTKWLEESTKFNFFYVIRFYPRFDQIAGNDCTIGKLEVTNEIKCLHFKGEMFYVFFSNAYCFDKNNAL